MIVEELCSKATSRIIVDRLYPEDDDTAFNELRGTSSKDFIAEIEELGKAQTKFQVDTNKITEELKELAKSINTATLNEVSTNSQTQPQQNNQNNNQRGNNKGNYRGNYRGNNPRFQNSRGRKNSLEKHFSMQNRQQYQNNWRPRNSWQNLNYQQSGRTHCNICNKIGHPPSDCWSSPIPRTTASAVHKCQCPILHFLSSDESDDSSTSDATLFVESLWFESALSSCTIQQSKKTR